MKLQIIKLKNMILHQVNIYIQIQIIYHLEINININFWQLMLLVMGKKVMFYQLLF